MFRYLTLLLWITLLVLTGTYLRTREGNSVEALTIDWLVFAQISVCLLGGAIGFFYMIRQQWWGFGVKVLCLFILFAFFSAFFNPYPVKVLGYWIMLAGGSLLSMSIVYSAETNDALERLEKIWLVVMSLLILKDTVTGLYFMPTSGAGDEMNRLGTGLTHAVIMSFNAAMAFLMSFQSAMNKSFFIKWSFRLSLIIVVVLSRSRMSLFCLLLGCAVRLWFQIDQKWQFYARNLRLAFLSASIFLISLVGLAISVELDFFLDLLNFLNRGQSMETILSVTGRTDIWANAIGRIFENVIFFLFGHGYATSRFILNDGPMNLHWYAYHAHNAFLEVFLSMGLTGFCAFILLIVYNLQWVFRFKRLQLIYNFSFSLRAASIVLMILIYSITEAELAVKIGPVYLLFIFYILALDRRKDLEELRNNIKIREYQEIKGIPQFRSPLPDSRPIFLTNNLS